MRKKSQIAISSNANLCLKFLKNRGGKARLSELTVSRSILQDLVNKGQVRVLNTEMGYFVQLGGNNEQI